jgi:hypothetical protein
MFGCLAMYDLITLKRVHVATVLSAAAGIGVFAAAMDVLIRTGIADAVIDALQ